MKGIPDSFVPAKWRGTTCVDRFGNQKIGVSFDLADIGQGSPTRLLLSIEDAQHLAESIQEALQENRLRTNVHPSIPDGMSSAAKSAPLDGAKV